MKDREDFLFKVCISLAVVLFILILSFFTGCSSSASVVLSEVSHGL